MKKIPIYTLFPSYLNDLLLILDLFALKAQYYQTNFNSLSNVN